MAQVGMVNLIWRRTVCNEREEYCVTLPTRFGLGAGRQLMLGGLVSTQSGETGQAGREQQGGVRPVADIGIA